MSYPELGRYAALGIGAFQLLANAAALLRGFSRLPGELVKEAATARIADLLRTSWVYGTLGNLCVSVVLIAIARPLRTGDPLARQLTIAIGVYYVVVGVGTYAFATSRHPGLLVFVVIGFCLLVALWFSA